MEVVPGHWQIMAANLAAQLTSQGIDPASLPHVTGIFNLPAMLIAALVTMLLVIGIKESANVNSVIVVIKVAVVLAGHRASARCSSNRENWHAVHPAEQRVTSETSAGAASCAGRA